MQDSHVLLTGWHLLSIFRQQHRFVVIAGEIHRSHPWTKAAQANGAHVPEHLVELCRRNVASHKLPRSPRTQSHKGYGLYGRSRDATARLIRGKRDAVPVKCHDEKDCGLNRNPKCTHHEYNTHGAHSRLIR